MKTPATSAAALVLACSIAACDILAVDNYDEPKSTIAGQVAFEGQPVGVRNGGVQLELWQPGFELNQKIPVHIFQDGTFSAVVFDGSYKLNLLANNGPWVNSGDTTYIDVRGTASVTIPVRPYYTIQNPRLVHNTSVNAPTGAIEATFKVGQIDTSRQLEFVGVYIGGTMFVDRNNSLSIANAVRERSRTAILQQLTANADINITVNLPADIYQTGSPVRRSSVFVRIGVKTVGVAEMLFTQVAEVTI